VGTSAPEASRKYGLSDEDLRIQANARTFADELIPFEVEAEGSDGELPKEVTAAHAERARELGLAAANMPRELGGGGCSSLQQVLIQEQVGRVTNALAWACSTPPSWLTAVATPYQIERFVRPAIRASGKSATRSPRRARARTWTRSRRPRAGTATATC